MSVIPLIKDWLFRNFSAIVVISVSSLHDGLLLPATVVKDGGGGRGKGRRRRFRRYGPKDGRTHLGRAFELRRGEERGRGIDVASTGGSVEDFGGRLGRSRGK